MSPRKLLFLTAVVLLLFAFILLFERKMPTTAEREQKGDLVWELPEDRIESIRLQNAGATVELKKGNDNRWRLVKPEAYPADASLVSDLVSQLARMKRTGGESAEARPEDYGLKTPSAAATVFLKNGGNSQKKLSRTIEFGLDIPGTDTTAARPAGSDLVVFVPSSVANLVKKKADEFKSKEVFGGSALDVSRLEVERGRGRLSLAKKNGIWWLEQPLADLADGDFAQRAIGELTGLKVLEFLPPTERQNLAVLGLAPPLYRVGLADAKGVTTTVDLGATRSDGNSIYARRENQVFTVPSTMTEDLSKEAVAFREAHLVRFDRLAISGVEGSFSKASFSFAKKDGSWNLGGRTLTASAGEDLLSALLDLKSRSFVDEAQANTLKSEEPAATATVRLSAGEPWTLKFYLVRGETRAVVSGRPGAFVLAGETVATLEAAFQKAASSLAPTPAPTKPRR